MHCPWVLKCGYKESIFPNPLFSKGCSVRSCCSKPHELEILQDHESQLEEKGDTPFGKLLAFKAQKWYMKDKM